MATLLPEGKQSFTNAAGVPLIGGKLYTYDAGTNNPRATYADAAGTVPNTNPIILDARGEATVFWNGAYKVVLKDSADVIIWTVDGVTTPETAGSAAGVLASLASYLVNQGSKLVAFIQRMTGAVQRTVEDKLAESVSVLDFGADPTGTTLSDAAFIAAHAASLSVYWPAGTYKVSTISLTRTGTTVRTDGFATIIQQASGQPAGTRVINVLASNVTLGDCKILGNIATDTDEQQHAVYINSGASTGNLSNITIGNVRGENIRGDVLYVGASAGYFTTYVTFGRITGSNIYRNVTSITGGVYVTGDSSLSDGPTGLFALDIEPDSVTCHDIYVGHVRGAAMGCQPPNLANAAYNIHIGTADMDPSFAPDSTPNYPLRFVRSALCLRNIKSFKIDYLKAYNHTHFALEYIWNTGEQRGNGIEIGYLDISNVGGGETTYNTAILASGIDQITIRNGRMAYNSASDTLILGDSSGATFTRAVIDAFTPFGAVARYIKQGRFSNIKVNSVSVATAFQNCDDCTIMDSDITLPTLLSFSARNTLINVAASCSTAYYGSSVTDTTRINCTFGGVTTGFATQRAAAAGQTGEVVYGSTTATTVGAAGGAAALPATPLGYTIDYVGGTQVKRPYYNP